MNPLKIRQLALCIFRRDGSTFVSKMYDPHKDEFFFRPIGGGIESGETPEEAIVRELREELNAEIENLTLVGNLENIFVFNNKAGHEQITLFEADFVDAHFYEGKEYHVIENGNIDSIATWEPLENFIQGKAIIYPVGILKFLK